MGIFRKIFTVLLVLSLLCLPSFAEEADHEGYIIKYKNSDDIEVVDEFPIMLYGESDKIEYIEPNYYYDLLGFEPVQNRYYMTETKHWNLKNISVASMWKAGLYGNGIKIAVIDSGVTVNDGIRHAVECTKSCVEGENINDGADIDGHGTCVANIIATNWNANAIAGVAPDVRIRSYKCFKMVDGKSKAAASDVKTAIDTAVADGCKVINMSLGSPQASETIEMAVNRANVRGAIIIAAAGNDGDATMNYPAAFGNVIGIGSVDKESKVSTFSNRNTSVFAVAPGTEVPLGISGNSIMLGNGTSFSAPTVAAIAALCLCANPGLDNNSFRSLLKNSCDDLGDAGYDTSYGYGLINCEKMFKKLMGTRPYFISPIRRYSSDKVECTIYNFTDKDWDGHLFFEADNGINSTAFSASSGDYGTALFPYGIKIPNKIFLWSRLY